MTDKLMKFLLKVLQGGALIPIRFEQDVIYTSQVWDKPNANKNISDVTVINLSTAGTIYVENIPLDPGQFKTWDCQWNEINYTQFNVRIPDTVTAPQVVIDYKVKQSVK